MTVTQVPQAGSANSAAKRYARAFYDYASECGDVAPVLSQIQALRAALATSKDLRSFLKDVRLDQGRIERTLDALVQKLGLDDALRRLIGVLAHNRRLPLLSAVLDAVVLHDLAHRGETIAEVCSAQPLSEAQLAQARDGLAEAGYHHVTLHQKTDPALIGGLTVRIGSTVFDTSIAGRLTRLQNAMKGAA